MRLAQVIHGLLRPLTRYTRNHWRSTANNKFETQRPALKNEARQHQCFGVVCKSQLWQVATYELIIAIIVNCDRTCGFL
jgi:hypothetical protein